MGRCEPDHRGTDAAGGRLLLRMLLRMLLLVVVVLLLMLLLAGGVLFAVTGVVARVAGEWHRADLRGALLGFKIVRW